MMPIELDPRDRDILEQLARKKRKPSKWQKAIALLGFAQNMPIESIVERSGITTDELTALFKLFHEGGLVRIGLATRSELAKHRIVQAGHSHPDRRSERPLTEGGKVKDVRTRSGTIEKTPDLCGGSARIAGTRIPVWVLVEAYRLGVSEAQLLFDYPGLQAVNLVDAWDYASRHGDEIAAEIRRNEVA